MRLQLEKSKRQVVLVLGVSGVGKTTACLTYVQDNSEFSYIRASAVLSELKLPPDLGFFEKQLAIAWAIFGRLEKTSNHALVDAHSLVEHGESILPIPPQCMEPIGATGIIFLELTPTELAVRRAAANEARRPVRTVDSLLEIQTCARDQAVAFSKYLGVPIVFGRATGSSVIAGLVDIV